MARNPESKTVLDFITWGNTAACVTGASIFLGRNEKIRGRTRARERGGKERAPPLPFACSPRAAFKNKLTGACYVGYDTEAAEVLIRYELL